jgi:exodeoxyribonuclease VII small subunit
VDCTPLPRAIIDRFVADYQQARNPGKNGVFYRSSARDVTAPDQCPTQLIMRAAPILLCSSNSAPENIVAKSKKTFTVEHALGELEALINAMEGGELTLEQSLQAFEMGIRLTRECQEALNQAEQKVQILLSEKGDTAPFADNTATDNSDAEEDDNA